MKTPKPLTRAREEGRAKGKRAVAAADRRIAITKAKDDARRQRVEAALARPLKQGPTGQPTTAERIEALDAEVLALKGEAKEQYLGLLSTGVYYDHDVCDWRPREPPPWKREMDELRLRIEKLEGTRPQVDRSEDTGL